MIWLSLNSNHNYESKLSCQICRPYVGYGPKEHFFGLLIFHIIKFLLNKTFFKNRIIFIWSFTFFLQKFSYKFLLSRRCKKDRCFMFLIIVVVEKCLKIKKTNIFFLLRFWTKAIIPNVTKSNKRSNWKKIWIHSKSPNLSAATFVVFNLKHFPFF